MQTLENPILEAPALHVMGTTCRVVLSGAQTGGKLTVVHVDVPEAGMGVPTHVHLREDETFHVLEGKLKLIVNGREVIVGPGESALGPRGVPHAWEALTPLKFVVSATPAGLEEMFAAVDAAGPIGVSEVIQLNKQYDIHFE
jgi:quercetin dioxygenase-like cupin family protein